MFTKMSFCDMVQGDADYFNTKKKLRGMAYTYVYLGNEINYLRNNSLVTGDWENKYCYRYDY